jgi:RNA polymerase sigma-70 factor (ECF subfamily)
VEVNLSAASCYTAGVGEVCLDRPVEAAVGAEPEDSALVARMGRGSGDALGVLYSRHGQALYGYLLRLAGDRGTAEEVLQDTLLAAWRSAGRFAGRSAVRTWLFGIARRQAHNRLRGKRLEWVGLAETAEVASSDPGPEAAVLAGAESEQLAAAVGRISGLHAEVLGLAFVEGLRYAEIATVLDVPVGTVKSRLSHAKAALAAQLEAG